MISCSLLRPPPRPSLQALIRQWEYQPIKRRVEKGTYYHETNFADDEADRDSPAPLNMKPRVRAGVREEERLQEKGGNK